MILILAYFFLLLKIAQSLKRVLYHEIFYLKTSTMAYNSIQRTPLRNGILSNKAVFLFLCMKTRRSLIKK